MRWNRQSVQTLVIVFLSVAAALFLIRFTADHDGETITIFGDDSPSASTSQSAPPSPSDLGADPVSGLPWVAEADLPVEARETLALIDAGGPFPYPDRDGITFQNREGILPEQDRGYYSEYTVPTPGEDDRGPRRIVTGEAGECYWTADHYASFEAVDRS